MQGIPAGTILITPLCEFTQALIVSARTNVDTKNSTAAAARRIFPNMSILPDGLPASRDCAAGAAMIRPGRLQIAYASVTHRFQIRPRGALSDKKCCD